MDQQNDQDLHENRARRYAEAITAAAAADERISALTDLLVQHEAARTSAESAVSAFQWNGHLGTIFHSGTDIPDDVETLMDVTDGSVWLRVKGYGEDGSDWWRDAAHGSSRTWHAESWPMDPGGPFIALSDDWKIRTMHGKADEHDENMKAIVSFVRQVVGFGGPTMEQPIDAVVRLKKFLDDHTRVVQERLVESNERRQELLTRIRVLEMRIDALVSQMGEAGIEPQGYDPR